MPSRPAPGRRRRPLRHRLQGLAEGAARGVFVDGVEQAALDPFRGYANAIHHGLPDAVAVLDAFQVVRLGTQVVDEVRRRVQQDTLGRRGHKHDPLYKIRGLLRHGWNTSPRSSRPRSTIAWTRATQATR
jgi:transposase